MGVDMKNDQELIDEILERDSAQALSLLVRKHQASVYNLIVKVVRNRQLAEELAQDTFIKSLKALHTLEDRAKYKPWLLRMAYHLAIDKVRLKKIPQSDIDESLLPITEHEKTPDPLVQLQQAERKKQVSLMLLQLDEVDRALMTLYYLEELSVQEVAETMALSSSNVKIRLMRARQQLKERLRRQSVNKEELY